VSDFIVLQFGSGSPPPIRGREAMGMLPRPRGAWAFGIRRVAFPVDGEFPKASRLGRRQHFPGLAGVGPVSLV
ncbi:MAG TPA: hypothetical protein VFG14_16465, partial [Chthoniobacteraceae bacterium]|nr:hypothetical protein [Chthoniobacteraceae bacterium]